MPGLASLRCPGTRTATRRPETARPVGPVITITGSYASRACRNQRPAQLFVTEGVPPDGIGRGEDVKEMGIERRRAPAGRAHAEKAYFPLHVQRPVGCPVVLRREHLAKVIAARHPLGCLGAQWRTYWRIWVRSMAHPWAASGAYF